MLYTTIKGNGIPVRGPGSRNPYSFKLRAVNRDGHSDWTAFNAKTQANPLELPLRELSVKRLRKTRAIP